MPYAVLIARNAVSPMYPFGQVSFSRLQRGRVEETEHEWIQCSQASIGYLYFVTCHAAGRRNMIGHHKAYTSFVAVVEKSQPMLLILHLANLKDES